MPKSVNDMLNTKVQCRETPSQPVVRYSGDEKLNVKVGNKS